MRSNALREHIMPSLSKIGLALTGIILVPLLWFLISPLFIDVEVNEAWADTRLPSKSALATMAPEPRRKLANDITIAMAEKAETPIDEPMRTGPSVVKKGMFRNADIAHKGSGSASIYRLNDQSHLLRLEKFRVTNGPDLKVYLVKHRKPVMAANVNEGFVSLGALKGNVGNQNYAIPADVELANYHSVVIWCELFGVLFSPASLSATP